MITRYFFFLEYKIIYLILFCWRMHFFLSSKDLRFVQFIIIYITHVKFHTLFLLFVLSRVVAHITQYDNVKYDRITSQFHILTVVYISCAPCN